MGKILGLDYGKIVSGLSITDENKIFAFGLDYVLTKNLIYILKSIIICEKIDELVVGMPIDLNNKIEIFLEKRIQKFLKLFYKLYPKIQVKRVDERFTSKISEQTIISMNMNLKKK
ncbi:RuvX/YqgF family protein [Blattabacterium cuenoti]|uniref:RuvX/YqgF family protein n=1 Tax=Blattabacterium cuenoti TaxID=1653831 RepID=UPI001EEC7361|nr:Holliday junction resolvase RuvX [Blattabacterium cuenoti]